MRRRGVDRTPAPADKRVTRLRARTTPGFLAAAGEAGLWCVFVMCLVLTVRSSVQAAESRYAAAALLAASPGPSPEPASSVETKPGTVLGSLAISEVGLIVPILEAADPATLSHGVGHVPGTALPGGLGNLVLAGHRDSYFRPLRNVRSGMQIEVATRAGKWQYAIDSTEIVTPDQVSVLDIGERPEMTLITCYPFNFVGSAPKRFIVHAHLLSADPT